MFKICSIGCGSIAVEAHGPALRKYALLHSDVILAACCDVNRDKAAWYKDKFGFKQYYTDISAMLDNEKPDAVCLIVPVSLTAELSIIIIEKGYPLIMEKPPGLCREETLRIIDAAERNNVPTQVAFNRRYAPLVRELKSILSSFELNDILNIRYDFYRVGRKDVDFFTTAIHGIDAVRYISGSDYEYIRFRYQYLSGIGTKVSNIFMDCILKSGITAQLSFCPAVGLTAERAVVNTYNHTFFLNLPFWKGIDSSGRLIHFEKDKILSDITGKEIGDGNEMFEVSGFYYENASFFDDLKAGRKPQGDVKSGLQSVEIAEYIRNRANEYVANY